MDSYCDINNAYTGKGVLINKFDHVDDNIYSLEKMARQVNSDKRSKTKDMYHQYRNNVTHSNLSSAHGTRQINDFLDNQNDKMIRPVQSHQKTDIGSAYIAPNTSAPGFYSAQGDFMENIYRPTSTSGTLVKNIMNKQIKKITKKKKPNYEDISLDTPSQKDINESDDLSDSESNTKSDAESNNVLDNLSNESSDTLITLDTKEIDNQVKIKAKYDSKKKSKRRKCFDFDLDSVDSLESLNSGESLLKHIKTCRDCKDKVITLIRKNKASHKKLPKNYDPLSDLSDKEHIGDRKSDYVNQTKNQLNEYINDNISQSGILSNMPEIKEMVTVCLIGFLVIMILDLLMRTK